MATRDANAARGRLKSYNLADFHPLSQCTIPARRPGRRPPAPRTAGGAPARAPGGRRAAGPAPTG
ncbi:hypothetical protein FLK63_36305, partial [Burkholderia gladioli]|nr:hypothetical protein [Burkholderia gladioli]